MTSSLSNSVDLVADARLNARVAAAVTEQALEVLASNVGGFVGRSAASSLARRAVADVDSVARVFTRLVADDATVSGHAVPAEVTDADIRRVVAAMWTAVAVALPNLT